MIEKSKVYWTSMRTKVGESVLVKLDRLITKGGIEAIDFKEKYAAIKVHFGEPGNLAFLRPNFARVVVEKIRSLGGKPFLTDCNTLYVGRRNNALVHLDAANENGYTPLTTCCQNIIADGLKGTDDLEVPVPGGVYCKTAMIGRAILDADIIVSLTHFKCHEMTGMGGALKNLGMGSGSRAGKMIMHNDGKPRVNPALCVGCRACAAFCNEKAISFGSDRKARIDPEKCVGCGRCIGSCNLHAISNESGTSSKTLCGKIAEYAQAVVTGKPGFHINIVNQISPFCDCHNESDVQIVPDIGIFAGFDPVALDQACVDAVNGAPAIPGSIIFEREATHRDERGKPDYFCDLHPTTDWRDQIIHAEKIGLGRREYELVEVR